MWLLPSSLAELCEAVMPGDAELIRRATADGGEVTLLVAMDGAATLAEVVHPDDTTTVLKLNAEEVLHSPPPLTPDLSRARARALARQRAAIRRARRDRPATVAGGNIGNNGDNVSLVNIGNNGGLI